MILTCIPVHETLSTLEDQYKNIDVRLFLYCMEFVLRIKYLVKSILNKGTVIFVS